MCSKLCPFGESMQTCNEHRKGAGLVLWHCDIVCIILTSRVPPLQACKKHGHCIITSCLSSYIFCSLICLAHHIKYVILKETIYSFVDLIVSLLRRYISRQTHNQFCFVFWLLLFRLEFLWNILKSNSKRIWEGEEILSLSYMIRKDSWMQHILCLSY